MKLMKTLFTVLLSVGAFGITVCAEAQMSNRVATVTECKADLAELEPYLTPAVSNTVMRMIAYRSEYQAKKEKERALKERMKTLQEAELEEVKREEVEREQLRREHEHQREREQLREQLKAVQEGLRREWEDRKRNAAAAMKSRLPFEDACKRINRRSDRLCLHDGSDSEYRQFVDKKVVNADVYATARAYISVTNQIVVAKKRVEKYRLADVRLAALPVETRDYYHGQMSNLVAEVESCRVDLAEIEKYMTDTVRKAVVKIVAYRTEREKCERAERENRARASRMEDELRKLHRQDENR